MPPSRNNENQQPNRGSLQRPLNSHRGAESGRPESSLRDIKPDLVGDVRDVKPDIGGGVRDVKPDIGGQGGQETAEGRSAMGIAPDYGYPAYAANTGMTPQTLGMRPNNTIPSSSQPFAYYQAPNTHHALHPMGNWMPQHVAPNPISLNSPPTTNPNSASGSRTLPFQGRDPRLPLHPEIPTPGMTRTRYRDQGVHPSGGPPLHQLPSTQSFSSLRPSINNDTPASGDESGLDDHIHSPNYGNDDSPTVQRTSHASVPLTAADPAIHSVGTMNPPNSTIRPTQGRAILAGQGRPQPYPSSPLSHGARTQRAAATTRAGPFQQPQPPINGAVLGYNDGAALGNDRPGAINGRIRAPNTARNKLVQTFVNAGRPIPSVLEEAETVPPTFTAIRSGPNSPFNQFSPATGAPSTPQVAFPGESFTPQVFVPGNTYAQTPTAIPGGTPAIGPDGQPWSGVSLPRFYAEQVGQPATPGLVSDIARKLEQVRIGTPVAEARPPRIPVPTPGNAVRNIRKQAVAAIVLMAKDEDGANFADPEHFVVFDGYVKIALGDGSTCEQLNEDIKSVAAKFTHDMERRAAYLCHHGERIPNGIVESLQQAYELGVRLWGVNACMTQVFKHEWESVQGYIAEQAAEAMEH